MAFGGEPVLDPAMGSAVERLGQPLPRAEEGTNEAKAIRRDSILVIVASVLVGGGNYGFTLVLVWALSARQFSEVSSVSSLLLVVSTGASASLPWVLAKQVAQSPPGSASRREAVSFALFISLAGGIVTSALVVLLASRFATLSVEAVAAAGTMAIFIWSVGSGYLQGARRLKALASFALAEVVLKIGFGLAFVVLGLGAVGALGGAAVGVGAVAVFGLWLVRHEISWPKRGNSKLWRQTGGIGSIQVAVSILTTLDVTVTSVVRGTSTALAGYQAMLVFGRIPLFMSTALSLVVFSRIAAAHDDPEEQTRSVAGTLGMYLTLSVATIAVIATIPSSLLDILLPHSYVASGRLLLPLAIAGLSAGLVNLTTTFFQAQSAFKVPVRVLAAALPVATVAFALLSGSVVTLAWTGAVIEAGLAVILTLLTARQFPGCRAVAVVGRSLVITAGATAGLRLAERPLGLWLVLAVILASVALIATRPRSEATQRRPRRSRLPFRTAGGSKDGPSSDRRSPVGRRQ